MPNLDPSIDNGPINRVTGVDVLGQPTPVNGGVYTATTPTLTDGGSSLPQYDQNGRQIVTLGSTIAGEDLNANTLGVTGKPINSSSYAPSFYQMPGTAVAAANVKSSAGSVQSFMATNANAAVRYFQIHNTASTPTGGAVPLRSFPINAGTALNPATLLIDRQYLASLIYCSTGISFGFSTTYLTYTAATPADHSVDINYV